MSEKDNGVEAGIKGVVEDVKGKAKEVVGNLVGNRNLEQEGSAQQDKAAAQREVAEKEAAAEKARGEAEVHESRERAAQQTD